MGAEVEHPQVTGQVPPVQNPPAYAPQTQPGVVQPTMVQTTATDSAVSIAYNQEPSVSKQHDAVHASDIGMDSKAKASKKKKWMMIGGIAALIVIAAVIGVVFVLTRKSGSSLGIPTMKPPVEDSTPEGLGGKVKSQSNDQKFDVLNGGNGPSQQQTPLQIIKDRLFNKGPTDFTERIGKVDERMQSLDKRNKEFSRKCVKEKLVDYEPDLPSGARRFGMKFSCQEDMGEESGLVLYFGKDDSNAYVAEVQAPPAGSNSPTMAVLAKGSLDGNKVHIWQLTYEDNGAVSAVEIEADKNKKLLQLSVAGTGTGLGLGCGIRFISENGKIYAEGKFQDQGMPSNTTCIGAPMKTTCANAQLTEQSASQCAMLPPNIRTTNMTRDGLDHRGYGGKARKLIKEKNRLPKLTNFND